jgi:hypothetical protein
MARVAWALVSSVVAGLLSACAEPDVTAPRVVSTVPVNGSEDVDPATSEIAVTFDEPMTDGNWSWVYESRESFPQMTGQAHYDGDKTTNLLPVRLEPGKDYVVWINSEQHRNFKDTSGNSSAPFKLSFRTR